MGLKEYREMAKISQAELAEKCGVTQSQISHLETGTRKLEKLSIEACRAIVSELNVRGVVCTLDDVFPPVSNETEAV